MAWEWPHKLSCLQSPISVLTSLAPDDSMTTRLPRYSWKTAEILLFILLSSDRSGEGRFIVVPCKAFQWHWSSCLHCGIPGVYLKFHCLLHPGNLDGDEIDSTPPFKGGSFLCSFTQLIGTIGGSDFWTSQPWTGTLSTPPSLLLVALDFCSCLGSLLLSFSRFRYCGLSSLYT